MLTIIFLLISLSYNHNVYGQTTRKFAAGEGNRVSDFLAAVGCFEPTSNCARFGDFHPSNDCSYKGNDMRCDASGYLQHIYLYQQGLSGTIPSMLNQFRALTSL
jgi:hypothetical protein